MSNKVDSMRYLYLDASGSLASGAYLICFVNIANNAAAAGSYVVIYDGQEITDPVIMLKNAPTGNSRDLNIIPPIQVSNGLYVVVPASYYVTIGYVPLS